MNQNFFEIKNDAIEEEPDEDVFIVEIGEGHDDVSNGIKVGCGETQTIPDFENSSRKHKKYISIESKIFQFCGIA